MWAFAWGTAIGVLGGLIGLGGAEFRLPVLIGFFKFRPMPAITINLIISLVTVVFSLVFRTGLGQIDGLVSHVPIVLNILSGSLVGSYAGARMAARMRDSTFSLVVVACLVTLSTVLIGHDLIFQINTAGLPSVARVIIGLAAGVVIGLFSSVLGVAGGEMIIPTLILLYGVEVKLAGSLSLAISIPTIGVALLRYSTVPALTTSRVPDEMSHVRSGSPLIASMAVGSIVGAWAGSRLLPYAPGSLLTVFLGIILLISAIRLLAMDEARS